MMFELGLEAEVKKPMGDTPAFKRIPVSLLMQEASATIASSVTSEMSSEGCQNESVSRCTQDNPTHDTCLKSSQFFRPRWTSAEDRRLESLVAEHGPRKWNSIAKSFPGRNGRQVRLRWMNHLNPEVDDREWTPEEDEVILEEQKRFGNRWTRIAMQLNGRSDNAIKNRFNRLQRIEAARKRRVKSSALG